MDGETRVGWRQGGPVEDRQGAAGQQRDQEWWQGLGVPISIILYPLCW